MSSFESDDYCLGFPSELTFTPPGVHCAAADLGTEGAGIVPPPDSGHWAGFLTVLAAGLVLVARGTKAAWATLIIAGLAGSALFLFGGLGGLVAGLIYGPPIAGLLTRSLLAPLVGVVAFLLAVFPWFISDAAGAIVTPLVLLGVALLPQRAEGRRKPALSL